MDRDVFIIEGLDCVDCATKLEKRIKGLDGVEKATVNFGSSAMVVEHEISVSRIMEQAEKLGYKVFLRKEPVSKQSFFVKNINLLLTLLAGLFLAAGLVSSLVNNDLRVGFYIGAIALGGILPAKRAFFSLKNAFVFDINVLMVIAVTGAVIIGELTEAAVVVFLFSLGNLLEEYSLEKTRKSIKGLMELAPREAAVLKGGEEVVLSVEEIDVGDVLIIRPGERIPIDGEILLGTTTINQAPITGEWAPVDKGVGDKVFAGTINEEGSLEIGVTKLVEDTTLARIIEMVEEAQSQKAPSQRFIDKFASYYTPMVIVMAILIVIIPPLLFQASFSEWFYRGLMLLVISCPCALVISTPVSIVSAIGNAARNGVLIKGGSYLEEAGSAETIFFDKTGTLTKGEPEVTEVINIAAESREELLKIAGGLERFSEHPLALALMNYLEAEGIECYKPEHFTSHTGKGVEAVIGGKRYYAGSYGFFKDLLDEKQKWKIKELQEEGKTTVLIGDGERVLGIIAAADTIRESSREAISSLRERGIKTVMLTGDNEKTAERLAYELGMDDYKAELLPEEKVKLVREAQKEGGKVIMVGDGINDAPALASADIGIAMGGAGTDAALETADIVLMADDPGKLPFAINLSKKSLRVIKENIIFAIGIKFAAIILVFLGVLNLWLAILADTGASLLVILNGMRLLR